MLDLSQNYTSITNACLETLYNCAYIKNLKILNLSDTNVIKNLKNIIKILNKSLIDR